jgi:hypothetical protein
MALDLKGILDSVKDTGLGGKKKRPKHGFRNTHIEHLTDGSHVARMQPYEGDETSFTAADHKELADKIKKYLGDAGEPEGMKEKNDSPSEEIKEKI